MVGGWGGQLGGHRRPWRRYLCRRYPYWTVGVVGYVVGLLLAFLANTLGFTIFDVKGQPALLYLVPCGQAPAMACVRVGH